MNNYKYYVVDYATGAPREIFRSDSVVQENFGIDGLYRAKRDGSWSDAEIDVKPLLNLWMKGDFDLDEDEISEEQAMAYLNEWRRTGSWPGRD